MDVYIVNTYYHLLIALTKTLLSKRKTKLIIFNDNSKNSIALNNDLIERLKKEKIFTQITVVGNPFKVSFENKNLSFYIKKLLFTKIFNKNFLNLIDSRDIIYIFNDTSDLGQILNSKKIKYILLEDGRDCFKKNFCLIKQNKSFKDFLKKFLYGSNQIGTSKMIKYIEVNDSKNLNIYGKKLIECNRDLLFSKLSDDEIKQILTIFNIENEIGHIQGEFNLLITQPFYKDGILDNKNIQLEMYEFLIKKYLNDKKIMIKIHPREENIYIGLDNSVIIDKLFPIELLNYLKKIKFSKILTVSSTSIDAITNCDEKIVMSWEWLEKYKKGDKNEK